MPVTIVLLGLIVCYLSYIYGSLHLTGKMSINIRDCYRIILHKLHAMIINHLVYHVYYILLNLLYIYIYIYIFIYIYVSCNKYIYKIMISIYYIIYIIYTYIHIDMSNHIHMKYVVDHVRELLTVGSLTAVVNSQRPLTIIILTNSYYYYYKEIKKNITFSMSVLWVTLLLLLL